MQHRWNIVTTYVHRGERGGKEKRKEKKVFLWEMRDLGVQPIMHDYSKFVSLPAAFRNKHAVYAVQIGKPALKLHIGSQKKTRPLATF